MLITESRQIDTSLVKLRLSLKDVQESLAAELGRMGLQENVVFRFFSQLFSEFDGLLKVELFEKGLGEKGEAVLVRVTLGENDGQGELGKGVSGELGDLLGTLVIGLRLILRATEEERSNHVSHKVLVGELHDVDKWISEVLSVRKESSEKSSRFLGREAGHENPMHDPLVLVEQVNGVLWLLVLDHFLQLAQRGQFNSLPRLLVDNLRGKETPEHLGDQGRVRSRLISENLLQVEKVLLSILVILNLIQQLSIIKERVAVFNRDLVLALSKLLQGELHLLAELLLLFVLSEDGQQGGGFLLRFV